MKQHGNETEGKKSRPNLGAAFLVHQWQYKTFGKSQSSFAEGLLTEAEGARSGDLGPSQSKLEP